MGVSSKKYMENPKSEGLTFVGTYHKDCKSWIETGLQYNIPFHIDEAAALELGKKIKHVCLTNKLHFDVTDASIVTRDELIKDRSYPNTNPHAKKYVLLTLVECDAKTKEVSIVDPSLKLTTNDFLKSAQKSEIAKTPATMCVQEPSHEQRQDEQTLPLEFVNAPVKPAVVAPPPPKDAEAYISDTLLDVLLCDRTRIKKNGVSQKEKNNICWATDHYVSFGEEYFPQEPITSDLLVRRRTRVIQPRNMKSARVQAKRTKDKAEVFTPSWVCNEQNNLVDEAWFGRKDVFNVASERSWTTNKTKIEFPSGKGWKDYIRLKRLEISCGEAPYLVSRYDTVTGMKIPVEDRIGLLDRKLRVISENVKTKEDWIKWAFIAYENIYGYEYQGDNILLARENLICTYIEHLAAKYNAVPDPNDLDHLALIVSWNIWQMDGLNFTVPYSDLPSVMQDKNFLAELGQQDDTKEETNLKALPCRIQIWRSHTIVEFRSLFKRGQK